MAYEVSSVHIAGYVKAARELGLLDAALPLIAPEYRAILDAPHRKTWVPAEVVQELTLAIAKTAPPERIGDINYRMSRDSMGPIVMPILRVAMALTGRSPATVFARLNDAVSAAVRGVELDWQPKGANAGTLTIRYPVALPPIVHHAWHGVFRFAYELAGREGRVVKHEYIEGAKAIRFELEWS